MNETQSEPESQSAPAQTGATETPEVSRERIQTPDGREFEPNLASSPLAAFLSVMGEAMRLLGKAIMTVWRLAGALDAALWQGLRLIILSVGKVFASSLMFLVATVRDLINWLPSRYGRAYTAASAIVLIIGGLWTLDQLKSAADLEIAGTSPDRPPVDLSDPILARMDGRYIRMSDIIASAKASGRYGELAGLTPEAAFDRGLVEGFVEQRLLARAAMENGVARNPEVVQRLTVARDRILAAAYMEKVIENATSPEKVQSFYESQVDITRLGDEVRAKHIVVATEDEARAIRARIEAGEDFSKVARTTSIDRATAPLGGELGYFTKDMMTPVLANAAFTTPKGEIAPLFFSEFGWHVLKVMDRRASASVPLTRVEEQITEFLRGQSIQRAVDEIAEEREVVYYRPAPTAARSGENQASND